MEAFLIVVIVVFIYLYLDGKKSEEEAEIRRHQKVAIESELEETIRNEKLISKKFAPFFYAIVNDNTRSNNSFYDWKKINILDEKPDYFTGNCIESNKPFHVNNNLIKIKLAHRDRQTFLNEYSFLQLEKVRNRIELTKKNIYLLSQKRIESQQHQQFEFEKKSLWNDYLNTFPSDLANVKDGYQFEKFIANLYINTKTYTAQLTSKSADQGVDIILTDLNKRKIAVQTKFYKSTVGNSSIMEVVAGKKFYKCSDAMVVTNSFFTKSAIQLANANKVKLIDGFELLRLCNDFLPKNHDVNKPYNEEEFKLIETIIRKFCKVDISKFVADTSEIDNKIKELHKETDTLWDEYNNILS